jgi:hypothetical protein
MTIYGKTAKVIGMFKELFHNDESYINNKHIIVAKSDLDIYITIKLELNGNYKYFGLFGVMWASYASLEIENIDINIIQYNITHYPINEYIIDLISINNFDNDYKCDLFEITKIGDKEKYIIDDTFSCPMGEYDFNEKLFVDYDIKKRKKLMENLKDELLEVTFHPSRISKYLEQGIKIGELDKII